MNHDGPFGDRMTPQERNARAYCRAIGADPDDIVAGYVSAQPFRKVRSYRLRWQWYIGARA